MAKGKQRPLINFCHVCDVYHPINQHVSKTWLWAFWNGFTPQDVVDLQLWEHHEKVMSDRTLASFAGLMAK